MSTHSSWFKLIQPIIGEAMVVFIVQFIPLITLSVFDYAIYSAIYLIYAVGLAVMFAVLADVWAREIRAKRLDPINSADSFGAVLVAICLTFALIGLAIGWLLSKDGLVGALSSAAVGMATFRAGARYFLIGTGSLKRAFKADLTGAIAGALTLSIGVAIGVHSLSSALAIWLAVVTIAGLVSGVRPHFSLRLTNGWIKGKKRIIQWLLGEALLMNLTSIGAPYFVGIVAGPSSLALLRGSTSLAYPVRLILGTARARIVSGQGVGRNAVRYLSLGALSLGGLTFTGLELIYNSGIARGSTLYLLSSHSISIAVLLVATAISTYYQFVARGSNEGRSILIRRVVHTAIVFGCIAALTIIGGEKLVIWGASLGTSLTVIIWFLPARNRKGK